MIDKKPMLRNWLDIVNNNFDKYDQLVTESQERCLLDFFANDELYKDKNMVKTLLYRQALYSTRRYDKYIEFLEKENLIDQTNLTLYKKLYFAYLYRYFSLTHDASGQSEAQKTFKSIKIPVSLPTGLIAKEKPLGEFSAMLPGYEKKWKEKKTAKLRDKAYRLRIKDKTQKAKDVLLNCFEKYGDVESAQYLAGIYKKELGGMETALKYYKIGMDNGFRHSYNAYYEIVNSIKYETNIEKADEYKGSDDEIKYLFEAYKYVQKSEDELRIVKLLFKPQKSYTNVELGKSILYTYLNHISSLDSTELKDFLLYFTKLAYDGKVIEENKGLAYLANSAMYFPLENYVKAKYDDMDRALLTIAENVQKVIETPDPIPMQNVFELGDDASDFDLIPRLKETAENFRKRKEYFAKAMASSEEKTIIENLKKAGKLSHAKAMVALYNYYLKANDIDNAYYWIFEVYQLIEKEGFTKGLMETVPVNVPKLLSCLYKHDQYYCQRFIEEHVDFTKKLDDDILKLLKNYATKGSETIKIMLYEYYSKFDVVKSIDLLDELKNSKSYGYTSAVENDIVVDKKLDDKVLERLEYYANRGNKAFQEKLAQYYSKFGGENELEVLYALADTNEPKYIHKLIEKKGGFNPDFDERYVQFLNQYKLRRNKYATYVCALLHADKSLCKKYDITYSEETVFHFLLASMEAENYGIDGLDTKVRQWLAKCYEYGIGTAINLEKSASLFEREGGNTVEFIYFSKYCLPQMTKLSNFHDIKEYFLSKIKPEDYERIFREVNRYIRADFKFSDIFAENGKYVGGQTLSKLIAREKEIERKLRLEEERKERERKELEKKEKLRQEEARRKKAEEEARLKSVKQTATKQTTVTKPVAVVTSSASTTANDTTDKAQAPLRAPRYFTKVPADNKYYLELVRDDFNNGMKDEMRAIASLREAYSYPPPPVIPVEFGMSKRKGERLYAEKLASRKGEISKYANRIFDLENPFQKYGHNNYRRKVWGYANDTVFFTGQNFADYVAKEFNKVSKIGKIEIKSTNYKFKDRLGKTSDEVYLVERMLAHTPIFADEITFEVKVHFEFHASYSSNYFEFSQQMSDYADRNHLSNSQRGDFNDYMHNSVNQALKNDINSPSEQRARAKINAEKAIKEYVNAMLKRHIVFAGKYVSVGEKKQYIEGVVHKIKTNVTFYSAN